MAISALNSLKSLLSRGRQKLMKSTPDQNQPIRVQDLLPIEDKVNEIIVEVNNPSGGGGTQTLQEVLDEGGNATISVDDLSAEYRLNEVGLNVTVDDDDSGDTAEFDVNAINGILLLANILKIQGISTFADNAAAITGGLATSSIYKTATGELRIVI